MFPRFPKYGAAEQCRRSAEKSARRPDGLFSPLTSFATALPTPDPIM
ncbi:MAG: hypothetical protein ACLRTQ_09800 [Candidatus Borkfalkia sp.]